SLPSWSFRTMPNLVRLAAESWIDGCLGEGAAARRAGRAARLARHDGTRRALVRIERDESRHAELAWDVVRWAVDRGGTDARDAIRDLAARMPPPPRVSTFGLESHGQLGPRASDV